MYALAFYKAWSNKGHDVECVNYEDFRFNSNFFLIKILDRIQDRYHYGFYMNKYNKVIEDKVSCLSPDFVFLYRCYHVLPRTIEKIRKKTIVFTYNNDDPFSGIPSRSYFRYYLNCAKQSHLNYVYRERNIRDFADIGIYNTKLLMPYYRKEHNYQIRSKKELPIVFIGHYENDGRDKLILKLLKENIPIIVFGDAKWKKAPLYPQIKQVIKPAKRGSEYNETINQARICLVLFSKLNHDTYTRRCFEIPATKTVMLSEYSEDMVRLFPEDECAVYFKCEEELVNKARMLLDHPELAQRIADKAYDKLQDMKASEYDRCLEIINDFKSLTGNGKSKK